MFKNGGKIDITDRFLICKQNPIAYSKGRKRDVLKHKKWFKPVPGKRKTLCIGDPFRSSCEFIPKMTENHLPSLASLERLTRLSVCVLDTIFQMSRRSIAITLSGLYLSRIHSSKFALSPSLAGFEAVLVPIYSSVANPTAARRFFCKFPIFLSLSLYHTPRTKVISTGLSSISPSVGVLSPPLEPQIAGISSYGRECQDGGAHIK
ncbi:uncharacterized protein LOC126680156 isoform X2 [Mercurialis annua]|uniref:uncharacterized protein LOC126680156 isoform X2 n=1 Tax=Mercurialis annua TaxID=3986 RepID=UPI002160713E|nr:uncharacterized protein LOC126680156 isoform X2 [Mercurialis annua]